MAGIRDLEPCDYLPVCGEHILAVGWLSDNVTFPRGDTPRQVYDRLVEFCKNPWQPFVSMGYHGCEICQFDGEQLGNSNLFFPHEKKILVCPELIVHYINAHSYQPPELFCEAVLACPEMDSAAYKKRLIECNGRILWQPRVG